MLTVLKDGWKKIAGGNKDMENKNSSNAVIIPLLKKKKNMVQLGCIFMMLSIAMFGLSLGTLQAPILEKMNAMSYFSLLTIFSSLGLTIMTPIGGKLGDLIGRRNIVMIAGIVCAVCGIGMGIVKSLGIFMALRLILGAAQGAFISAPYILAREINEEKDVPKVMGLLSSSIAIGGFAGSIIAGILTDRGYLEVAIMFPAIFLIIGVLLISLNLPNKKPDRKVKIDTKGMVYLTIGLVGILLSLNYGPKIGWINWKIGAGFLVGIVFSILFVKNEKVAEEPIIPLDLFKNGKYVALLAVGFICYFYMNAMNNFAPLAVQKVLGKPAAVAGALQMPRTIITMLLPMAAGVWVAKKSENTWKAMGIATLLTAVPFIPLAFTGENTNIVIYFIAITITGIAESFRAVSITPAAQKTLKPKDLGVGTSLVNFINSMSGLIAAVVFGIAYDMKIIGDAENVYKIVAGVNRVFLISAIVGFIGFVIVITVVRKQYSKKPDIKTVDESLV